MADASLEELTDSEEDIATKMTDKTDKGKARKSPIPERKADRRRRKPLVKDEEAQDTAGRGSSQGPGLEVALGSETAADGGGGQGVKAVTAVTGDSTPTDDGFSVVKTSAEIQTDLKSVRDDLDHEIQKRRQLEDELDIEKVRINEHAAKLNANTQAIQKIIQTMAREGEHNDSNRVLVIKKRQYSMRNFFGNFVEFQNHFMANHGVSKISSAGPIWQIEVKGPGFAQTIKDSVSNWCNQRQMDVAVIRGKSNIAELKERICAGCAESIARLFQIPKGKGKGNRITICWPNNRPESEFRIIADGYVVLKGRVNLLEMRYDLTISETAAAEHLQTLCHDIREWEHADRTGYMLPLQIAAENDLSNCDWGRPPKGFGKGGKDGGNGGKGANGGGGAQLGGAQLGKGANGGGAQLGAAQLGNGANGGGGHAKGGNQAQAQLGLGQLGNQAHAQGGNQAPAQIGGGKGGAAWQNYAGVAGDGQQQHYAGGGMDAPLIVQPQGVAPPGLRDPGNYDAWAEASKGLQLGSRTAAVQQSTAASSASGGDQMAAGGGGARQLQTYANTPVTPIGATRTVTNPDGSPFSQADMTQPRAS